MMDGTQATQLRTLLQDAADALDRASAIVFVLDSADRAIFSVALDEISSALHFELLQKVYLRYPSLQTVTTAGRSDKPMFHPGQGRDEKGDVRSHIADSSLLPQ
jgi:hypothetical protein